MTDSPNHPETEAPEAEEPGPIDTTGAPAPEADEAPETAADEGPNQEAARYRRRLRTAEQERDDALDALADARRRHVESLIVADGRAKPAAVWGFGATDGLDGLVGADGHVDPVLVVAAIQRAGDTLGLKMTRRPAPDPTQGRTEELAMTGPSWSDALRRN